MKVIVTDYIEDNLDWEAEELSKHGIEFEALQLKFRPEEEVVEKTVPFGKGKILIMDDEESIRELLYTELTETGYDVELANDGTQAIAQYIEAKEAGQSFDAVILDLTIPGGMGGKEAITKLLEIDPKVKAIVSSGYATDPIISEYKKYGFSAVVTKPYSVVEIEKALHGLLNK